MVLDISLLIYLSKCSFNIGLITEIILIIGYSIVVVLLEIHQIGDKSQIIEFYLLLFRLFFLVLRCIFITSNLILNKKRKKESSIMLNERDLVDREFEPNITTEELN